MRDKSGPVKCETSWPKGPIRWPWANGPMLTTCLKLRFCPEFSLLLYQILVNFDLELGTRFQIYTLHYTLHHECSDTQHHEYRFLGLRTLLFTSSIFIFNIQSSRNNGQDSHFPKLTKFDDFSRSFNTFPGI